VEVKEKYHGISLPSTSYTECPSFTVKSIYKWNHWGTLVWGSTYQLLSDLLHLSDTGGEWVYNETVHHLFIDLKKACDSVRKEVLHNILRKSGVTIKLVRLIKMCLNETCNKACISKHSSDISVSSPECRSKL
jgi:hypothetical protein